MKMLIQYLLSCDAKTLDILRAIIDYRLEREEEPSLDKSVDTGDPPGMPTEPAGLKPGTVISRVKVTSTKVKPPAKKKAKKVTAKLSTAPKAGTIIAKVWDALKQSSGLLTSNELAEVLELDRQKVSTSLSALVDQHPSVLKRTWSKGSANPDGTGKVGGFYQYQYTGKGGAS